MKKVYKLYFLLLCLPILSCATGQYAEVGPQGSYYSAWAVTDLSERFKNWVKPESQIYAVHYDSQQEICVGVVDGQGQYVIKYHQRHQFFKIDPKIPPGCFFCGAGWRYRDSVWGHEINPQHPYFQVKNRRDGEHVLEITIHFCNSFGEVIDTDIISLTVYMAKSKGDHALFP
jgi:hypothetical protein